jgi:hypothetical protein
MSEMFSGADLPQQVRLDSSAGVREARNMEDSRHLRRWTRFEETRKEVGRTLMNVLSISKGSGNYSSSFSKYSRAPIEVVRYKDAIKTLQGNQYSWTLEAVPLSMMSPAARRETIRDYVSRGQMDDAEARRAEANPNLEKIEDLEMASYDDVYRHIRLMERGEYEAPTELTNLTFGIKRVTQNLHRLRDMENVPKSILEDHVRWIVTGVSIQESAVAMSPNQPAPFAPTQGMPGTNAMTLPPPSV